MKRPASEPTIGSSGHQVPDWLREVSCPSVGPQAGQFGRSETEAKLHSLGLDPDPRTSVASCEAFAGPTTGDWTSRCLLDHGRLRSLATALARSFVVAEGPKRLLSQT